MLDNESPDKATKHTQAPSSFLATKTMLLSTILLNPAGSWAKPRSLIFNERAL